MNFQTIKQDVVDEILFTVSPKLIAGANEAGIFLDHQLLELHSLILNLLPVSLAGKTEEIYLQYKIIKRR